MSNSAEDSMIVDEVSIVAADSKEPVGVQLSGEMSCE